LSVNSVLRFHERVVKFPCAADSIKSLNCKMVHHKGLHTHKKICKHRLLS
jgi:hypothetical protein